MSDSKREGPCAKRLRWWPAAVVLLAATVMLVWVHAHRGWSFQERNLWTISIGLVGFIALLVWWLAFSRVARGPRFAAAIVVAAAMLLAGLMFRIRGFSGDVMPVFEFRWAGRQVPARLAQSMPVGAESQAASALGFPQFQGPNRDAVLEEPVLERNWTTHPPRIVWRQAIGAAWSGWAIVGRRAFTQEQRQDGECASCYDLVTGELLWTHADPAHYRNPLAGEGPRCTPTVVSNRVFTLGATGILNCLEAANGKLCWSRNLVTDALCTAPEWGFAGSPLVFDGKVHVSAGGPANRSLLAYRSDTGALAWSAGTNRASYSSPFLAVLAGKRQILAFNSRRITAHDAGSGNVLWNYPWGIGEPQVSEPVVVGAQHVLFSSAYGVGSELLEISADNQGKLSARRVWRSNKMKSKFGSLVQRGGFLYGLDDGVLACLDLKDGSQRWKAGRYGHGQALLVRDLLLLMEEGGNLVLLQPTPEGPNELHRFPVFQGKTWNPIALSGRFLLARTEREAACLQLPVESGPQ